MPNATPSLDTIFCEAIEIASSADRLAYLAQACGPDDVLRQRVEALVAAHFRAGGSFLEHPAVDSTAAFAPGPEDAPGPATGTAIGPYTLREQIGEGGMGLVYVAEQVHPVRRKVALKVIKPGMDSRQVVARFEAERQALALMDHSNIAKVFDAGTTPEGRPYFVMELVKGTPLTDYCDAHRLTIHDRLGLFLQVCAAVQHAHQKGVIHRDLKPSNVLVAVHDVTPVAKVIDFGIAKAVGQSLTDKTVYTAFAQMIGTPLYMSPEQAGQSSLDVDTRTDVYALGVLLYELLTGTTPIDPETVRKVGLDEVRRIIREDEPPRPSARMSTLKAAAQSTVADKRNVDPQRLARLVRGELDWVVMKCLEKDRNRRYETASALAADVQRFLSDEPVMACPPSAAYRLRKFARRNKAALSTAAVVAVALIAGTAVSVWQAVEANRARRDADDRLQNELRAKAEAAESHRRSRAAVKQMLTRVATDEVGRIPAMKETRMKLLEDAAAFYTELLTLDPKDSEALFERGKVYMHLRRYDEAIRDLEATIGLVPDHLPAHFELGQAWSYGKLDRKQGLPYFTRAVELDYPARFASEFDYTSHEIRYHLAWHHAMIGNSSECNKLLQVYLELAPPSAATSRNLAALYGTLRDFPTALHHARRAVEQDPNDAWSHYILAESLSGSRDTDGALAAVSDAVRLNPYPYDLKAGVYYRLRAKLYLDRGDHTRALADYNHMTETTPLEWVQFRGRATCHFHLGNYPAALADIAKAVELKPDETSSVTWIGPENVAACPDPAFRQGMIDQATHAITLTNGSFSAYLARATLYSAMGEDEKARQDWETTIIIVKKRVAELEGKPGPDRDRALTDLATAQASQGLSLLRIRRFAEVEPILRECLGIREKVMPDDWLRFNAMSMLGESLLGQGKCAEAEPLLFQGYAGMKQREATIPEFRKIRLPEAVERIVLLYEATNRPELAREWRAKLPPTVAPPPRPVR